MGINKLPNVCQNMMSSIISAVCQLQSPPLTTTFPVTCQLQWPAYFPLSAGYVDNHISGYISIEYPGNGVCKENFILCEMSVGISQDIWYEFQWAKFRSNLWNFFTKTDIRKSIWYVWEYHFPKLKTDSPYEATHPNRQDLEILVVTFLSACRIWQMWQFVALYKEIGYGLYLIPFIYGDTR